MFELRIDIFYYNSYIIWSLYCEPAPLSTLQAQGTTPSIYLHTHVVWHLVVGFQIFSSSPTYIPDVGLYHYLKVSTYRNIAAETVKIKPN